MWSNEAICLINLLFFYNIFEIRPAVCTVQQKDVMHYQSKSR